MRILIAGAGATGGYFGARLAQAGRDVTFLVRPRRAEQLRTGLHLIGPHGTEVVPVRTVTAEDLHGTYDLVVVAVKAWSLRDVSEQVAPAVGPQSLVLPFLNGMAHLPLLNRRFGADRVLGGVVRVVAALDADGAVRQLQPLATMAVGTQPGTPLERLGGVAEELSVPGYAFAVERDITAAMWHKWAFITAAGVVTCLVRAPVGAVVAAPGGEEFVHAVVAETEQVAAAAGHPVPDRQRAATRALLTEPGSAFTSSLYRDVTAGSPHEGEHLLGAFVDAAAELGVPAPLTGLALLQLRAHDHLRAGGPDRPAT